MFQQTCGHPLSTFQKASLEWPAVGIPGAPAAFAGPYPTAKTIKKILVNAMRKNCIIKAPIMPYVTSKHKQKYTKVYA